MNTLLNTLIVWLVLLAVPFQGFASATTRVCSPLPVATEGQAGATVHGAGHDHALMPGSHATQHQHHAGDRDGGGLHEHHSSSADHHAGEKCSACSACCLGAALPAYAKHVAAPPSLFAAIPFDAAYLPTVDLALPERPPSFLLA